MMDLDKIVDFLNEPKLKIAILSIDDFEKRIEVESLLIDKYITEFIKEYGYIPENCDDEKLFFEPCEGCGLCNRNMHKEWIDALKNKIG